MKIRPNLLVLSLTLFLAASALLFTENPATTITPEGYWKTIDDKTGEEKSIIKIWIAPNGTLKGQIVKIFPKPNEDPNPKCDKCTGSFKNKPVLGMEFMWGFKGKGTVWKEGKIIDPENGKTYNCQLEVDKTGKKLEVFGYIRIIFKIGRSQTWIRHPGL